MPNGDLIISHRVTIFDPKKVVKLKRKKKWFNFEIFSHSNKAETLLIESQFNITTLEVSPDCLLMKMVNACYVIQKVKVLFIDLILHTKYIVLNSVRMESN